jgi:hypothetical protein
MIGLGSAVKVTPGRKITAGGAAGWEVSDELHPVSIIKKMKQQQKMIARHLQPVPVNPNLDNENTPSIME